MSCTRYHPLLLLLLSRSYGALLRSRPVAHLVRDTDLSAAGTQPEAGGSGDLSEAAAPGPCSMLLVHAGKAARAAESVRAGILKRQGKRHLQQEQLADSLPPETARKQLACECTYPITSPRYLAHQNIIFCAIHAIPSPSPYVIGHRRPALDAGRCRPTRSICRCGGRCGC